MRKPKIAKTYSANRDKLKVSFSVAHAFLLQVEDDDQLWLSTATNAHVYLGDSFLAYLKIRAPELKPPSMLLSPRFNNRIVEGTTDRSSLLFPEVLNGVLEQHGDGWWEKRAGGAVELTPKTPAAFFDDLLVVLRRLRR